MSNTETPRVGDGATICYWSDRSPATVIAVSKTGHKVTIQLDNYTRIDNNGMSDCQDYEYTPNPEGATYTVTRRRTRGVVRYCIAGGNTAVVFGHRRRYHDFSF